MPSVGHENWFKNEIPFRHYEAWAVWEDKALKAAGLPCPLPRSFGPIYLPWAKSFPLDPVGTGAALGWEASNRRGDFRAFAACLSARCFPEEIKV